MMLMLALALRLAFQQPKPVVFTHAQLVELYQECLEEHDIEADENDGECEEP